MPNAQYFSTRGCANDYAVVERSRNSVQVPHAIPTIRIRTLIKEDLVIISIADNDPGMAEEVRKRVFEPPQ
jgi:signal transduction histidine kinase